MVKNIEADLRRLVELQTRQLHVIYSLADSLILTAGLTNASEVLAVAEKMISTDNEKMLAIRAEIEVLEARCL